MEVKRPSVSVADTIIYDVAIVGGGPAGSAAAITAARRGAQVLFLERGQFPRDKVCGEFVSPESLELLTDLLGDAAGLVEHAPKIARARIFIDGQVVHAPIRPPAASIARLDLDAALWQTAQSAGAECRSQTAVRSISGTGPFVLVTEETSFQARSVVDASGRWSNLRKREVESRNGNALIGLKAHFLEGQPSHSVDLYFFNGGYCGVQPVRLAGSNYCDLVNACALVRADRARNLREVFALSTELQSRSRSWQEVGATVSTAQLTLGPGPRVCDGVLLAGDAAGFIDPFAGDGISLAIRSGAIAAEALHPFWKNQIPLAEACDVYEKLYRRRLAGLFWKSASLRQLLKLSSSLRSPLLRFVSRPWLAEFLVRRTRGKMGKAS